MSNDSYEAYKLYLAVKLHFICNFFNNSKTWIGNLVRADGETNYTKWKKFNQSFTYNFRSDCLLLNNTISNDSISFDDLFRISGGQHPRLLRLLLSGQVSVQTIIILDKILSFIRIGIKKLPKRLYGLKSHLRLPS